MVDEELGRLERRARETGALDDLARYVRARLRAGLGRDQLVDGFLHRLGIDPEQLRRRPRQPLFPATPYGEPHGEYFWDPATEERIRRNKVRKLIEGIPPEMRPLVRHYPWDDADLQRWIDEAVEGPQVLDRHGVPGTSRRPIGGQSVEAHRVGDDIDIVVRDADGVELRRMRVDKNFDPKGFADAINPGASKAARNQLVSVLKRMAGLAVILLAAFKLWEVANPDYWIEQGVEVADHVKNRDAGSLSAWLIAMGLNPFFVEILLPYLEAYLGQLSRVEAVKLARRILEVVARLRPVQPEEPETSAPILEPTPTGPTAPTRRNRIYDAPMAPSPPRRPTMFPDLTKGDILWRMREEERSQRQGEAEIETLRGRLAWYRWLRDHGATDLNDWIAKLEEELRHLIDRIARRRKRLDGYEEALDDPHREPGRVVEFPPPPEVTPPTPPDVEAERELVNRIAERNARIDELVERSAKLPPGKSTERERLEELLREAERERDERQAELDALRRARARVRAEELEEEGRALEAAARRSEVLEPSPSLRVGGSASTTAMPPRKRQLLDLLGMWAELREGYRQGIDVSRIAHRRGIDMSRPLDVERTSPRDLEMLVWSVTAALRDLGEVRVAQMGRPGGGRLLDLLRERGPGPIAPPEGGRDIVGPRVEPGLTDLPG